MIIETKNSIYEIWFGQVQAEITAICNMNCMHCRNSFDRKSTLTVKQIKKLINFALNNSNDLEFVVSGGEPFLHPEIKEILNAIKKADIKKLFITTNGSVLKESHISLISQFEKSLVSVSLDDLNPKIHDKFRNHQGAFKKAVSAIELLIKNNVKTGIRLSARPNQLDKLENFVKFALDLGINRLSISGIFPVGNAVKNQKVLMKPEQKKRFLERIFELRHLYSKTALKITTNDPLQHLCRGAEKSCKTRGGAKSIVLNGCSVGASTNLMANGDLTPCAMLNLPIMNIINLTISQIKKRYRQSPIVKNLLDMNTKGKCGSCVSRVTCGGCRARALSIYGDYLAEDPDCWI